MVKFSTYEKLAKYKKLDKNFEIQGIKYFVKHVVILLLLIKKSHVLQVLHEFNK
jgi:hypothetical protein